MHISDFTQAAALVVLALVNEDNSSFFTPETVSVERSATAPVTKNSVALLTALPGSGYSGTQEVEYDRLAISGFVDLYFPDGLTLQLGNATTLIDLLPEVNTALGTALVEGLDVEDEAIPAWEGIPNETKEVDFAILASSLVYTGTLTFTLDGNDIPLSSVITTTVLSGLNLPVVEPEG